MPPGSHILTKIAGSQGHAETPLLVLYKQMASIKRTKQKDMEAHVQVLLEIPGIICGAVGGG